MRNQSLIIIASFFLLFCGCANVKIQSANTDQKKFYLNHRSGDDVQLKKPIRLDFYLFGLLPGERVVYLEDYFHGDGIKNASSIEVSMQRRFFSYFLAVTTLGVYYPVDIEISLYTKKSDSLLHQFSHPILETEENLP